MHPPQRPATVDDAGGQAASSPRGQQHVSTGHEDLREGDADTPTHTPAEDPLNPTPTTSTTRHARHQAEDPQPNHPEKHNQDTPPTVTGPTTSTTRSHDEQVPFSRKGRAAAPTGPHQ